VVCIATAGTKTALGIIRFDLIISLHFIQGTWQRKC